MPVNPGSLSTDFATALERPPKDEFTPYQPSGPKPPFTAIYDQEYFSGSQVSIYVGDIWVDEITSLSYSVSQNKTPIYGYASQLFDATAAGQVIVQGNFTINYKEQGYLWAVLSRYKSFMEGKLSTPITPNTLGENTRSPSEGSTAKGHSVNYATPDTVDYSSVQKILEGGYNKTSLHEQYLSIAGYVTFDTDSEQDKSFENLMEAFENQVWGGGNTQAFDSQIRRTDANQFDGFDLYVVFGNYSNDMANHTAQKISGVRLLSQGKQIIVGGAPIQEEYSFLARTVV
jgi:hypothetical protein